MTSLMPRPFLPLKKIKELAQFIPPSNQLFVYAPQKIPKRHIIIGDTQPKKISCEGVSTLGTAYSSFAESGCQYTAECYGFREQDPGGWTPGGYACYLIFNIIGVSYS